MGAPNRGDPHLCTTHAPDNPTSPPAPPTWTDREKNKDDFYYNLEPATTDFNLYAEAWARTFNHSSITLYDVLLCIPTPSGPLSGQRRNEERWVVR